MEKAPWLLFWASVILMLVGIADRLTTNAPVLEGVAPGTYWKAGIALIGYSIALSALQARKSSA